MPEVSGATARLPASYTDARVRGVLPYCAARDAIGLAFDVVGQDAPVRVAIPAAHIDFLLRTLTDYSRSPTEESAHA